MLVMAGNGFFRVVLNGQGLPASLEEHFTNLLAPRFASTYWGVIKSVPYRLGGDRRDSILLADYRHIPLPSPGPGLWIMILREALVLGQNIGIPRDGLYWGPLE
jgi:hypothetical protein